MADHNTEKGQMGPESKETKCKLYIEYGKFQPFLIYFMIFFFFIMGPGAQACT